MLGGPHEVVTRFTSQLHSDLRGVLDEAELALDVNTSSEMGIDEALEPLRQRWRELAQWEALQRLLSMSATGDGGAMGIHDTLSALGRRQVGALVLAPRADAEGLNALSAGSFTWPATAPAARPTARSCGSCRACAAR